MSANPTDKMLLGKPATLATLDDDADDDVSGAGFTDKTYRQTMPAASSSLHNTTTSGVSGATENNLSTFRNRDSYAGKSLPRIVHSGKDFNANPAKKTSSGVQDASVGSEQHEIVRQGLARGLENGSTSTSSSGMASQLYTQKHQQQQHQSELERLEELKRQRQLLQRQMEKRDDENLHEKIRRLEKLIESQRKELQASSKMPAKVMAKYNTGHSAGGGARGGHMPMSRSSDRLLQPANAGGGSSLMTGGGSLGRGRATHASNLRTGSASSSGRGGRSMSRKSSISSTGSSMTRSTSNLTGKSPSKRMPWKPPGNKPDILPVPVTPSTARRKHHAAPGSTSTLNTAVSGKLYSQEKNSISKDGQIKLHVDGNVYSIWQPVKEVPAITTGQQKPRAPNVELQMSWIHGYRGKDARNNLFTIASGELAYYIAAVVVLYNPNAPPQQQQQRHYLEHSGEIKSLAVHPDGQTLASGQAALAVPPTNTSSGSGGSKRMKTSCAHVRVWNSANLHTLAVLDQGQFECGVCCLQFGGAGQGHLLCTVDESAQHVMAVWRWQQDRVLFRQKLSEDPIIALLTNRVTCTTNDDTGRPASQQLQVVTCGKAHLVCWHFEEAVSESDSKTSDALKLLDKQHANFSGANIVRPKYVTTMLLTAQNSGGARSCRLVTGDSNGVVLVWTLLSDATAAVNTADDVIADTGTTLATPHTSLKIEKALLEGHSGSVFSLIMLPDNQLISAGSKDGRLVRWCLESATALQVVQTSQLRLGSIRTMTTATHDSRRSHATHGTRIYLGTTRNCIVRMDLKQSEDPIFETLIQGHSGDITAACSLDNAKFYLSVAKSQGSTPAYLCLWELNETLGRYQVVWLRDLPLELNPRAIAVYPVKPSPNSVMGYGGGVGSGVGEVNGTLIITSESGRLAWIALDLAVLNSAARPRYDRRFCSAAGSASGPESDPIIEHLADPVQQLDLKSCLLASHPHINNANDVEDVLLSARFSPDGTHLCFGSQAGYLFVFGVSESGRHFQRLGKCSTGASSASALMVSGAPAGSVNSSGSTNASGSGSGGGGGSGGAGGVGNGFIERLDWSVDSRYLRSQSGGSAAPGIVHYWIPRNFKHVQQPSFLRDVVWATTSVTLSWDVIGIWPSLTPPSQTAGSTANASKSGSASNLMTTTLASSVPFSKVMRTAAALKAADQPLLLVGDEIGRIRIFAYPSSVFDAQSTVSPGGHSGFVSGLDVQILSSAAENAAGNAAADSSRLVSAGGLDSALIEWRMVPSRQ